MNRDKAKELLPIIQAFAEGKTIQFLYPAGWRSLEGAVYDLSVDDMVNNPSKYRVKPEPLECYIVVDNGDMWLDVPERISIHDNIEGAAALAEVHAAPGYRIVHMREVTDESN